MHSFSITLLLVATALGAPINRPRADISAARMQLSHHAARSAFYEETSVYPLMRRQAPAPAPPAAGDVVKKLGEVVTTLLDLISSLLGGSPAPPATPPAAAPPASAGSTTPPAAAGLVSGAAHNGTAAPAHRMMRRQSAPAPNPADVIKSLSGIITTLLDLVSSLLAPPAAAPPAAAPPASAGAIPSSIKPVAVPY